MRAAVQAALRQQVIPGAKQRQERGRDGGHAACGHKRRLGILQRRELAVQRQVVRRVVEPGVTDVVVACDVGGLEGGGLKDRHGHGPLDPGARFSGVNQLRFQAAVTCRHRDSLPRGNYKL